MWRYYPAINDAGQIIFAFKAINVYTERRVCNCKQKYQGRNIRVNGFCEFIPDPCTRRRVSIRGLLVFNFISIVLWLVSMHERANDGGCQLNVSVLAFDEKVYNDVTALLFRRINGRASVDSFLTLRRDEYTRRVLNVE